jgi:hypothetical protein
MWKELNLPAKKAGQEGVIMAAKSKRRKIKVAPYDSADYLKTEADIKNYLEAVFEEPMDRQMLIHTPGRCRSSARHDEALEGYRPHPSRTLQSTLSRRKSEFRDEDCRRIWYAAEIDWDRAFTLVRTMLGAHGIVFSRDGSVGARFHSGGMIRFQAINLIRARGN